MKRSRDSSANARCSAQAYLPETVNEQVRYSWFELELQLVRRDRFEDQSAAGDQLARAQAR